MKRAEKVSRDLSEMFGIPIVITPEQIETYYALSKGSEAANDIVIPFVNKITKAIGLKPSSAVTEPLCKKLMRAFAKATTQYNGNVTKVPDIGRMRILIEKPENIIALRRHFLGDNPRYHDRIGIISKDMHTPNKILVCEFEDYYLKPSKTGRIGVHITLLVKVPGVRERIPFEIQVLHKDMVETEFATRRNYEQAQMIERKARAEGRINPDGTTRLTDSESEAIHNYNESSRALYRAGALHHDLYKLRHPDLRNLVRRLRREALALQLCAA